MAHVPGMLLIAFVKTLENPMKAADAIAAEATVARTEAGAEKLREWD